MAKIRIYQSHFYVPTPPTAVAAVGVPRLHGVYIKSVTPRQDGAMVATGSNGPELWNPPTAAVVGVPIILRVHVKSVTPRLDGAMMAAGSNGPEQWKPPVATTPAWGWTTNAPDLVRQRKAADPEGSDADSQAAVSPFIQAVPTGWSVVLPELRKTRPAAPLAALDSLSLPLGLETPPRGWTVSLAELRQVRTRIGFADASIDCEAWAPLQTVAPPWGWSLPPPDVVRRARLLGLTRISLTPPIPTPVWSPVELPVLTRRVKPLALTRISLSPPIPTPTSSWVVLPDLVAPRRRIAQQPDQAELYNPPVVTTPSWGWSINAPDLARPKRPALGELSSRLDQPPSPLATGWSVVTHDLPAFRRKSDLGQALGRVDPPQFAPYGWSVTLPELLPKARRDLSAFSFRFDPSLTFPVGWSVTLPDFPQFKREIALPDQASGLEHAPPSAAAIGWTVEPPITLRRPTSGGALAGATPAPQPVTSVAAVWGWSVVLPDLRRQPRSVAFQPDQAELYNQQAQQVTLLLRSVNLRFARRVIALQPDQAEIYNPPSVTPTGWTVTLPDLATRRRQVAEYNFRADQPVTAVAAVSGWSVTLPDLPQFKRPIALPSAFGLEQPPTLPAAVNWSVEPALTQRRPTTIGALAGADLPPEPIYNLAPYGWPVVLPDLPAFRRKQALPETTGRIDPPAAQPYGWNVVLPDLPSATRKPDLSQVLPRLDQPQPQSFGWNVVLPDLARLRRVALPETTGRFDQTAPSLAWGWSIVLPDLPAFRRFQALPEYSARIDFVFPSVIWGWQSDQPAIIAQRRSSFAGPDLPPQPVTSVAAVWGWSVALPELSADLRLGSGALVGATLALPAAFAAFAEGWAIQPPTVVYQRRQLGVSCVDVVVPPPAGASTVWGWQVDSLTLRRSIRQIGASRTSIAGLTIAAPVWGWPSELPVTQRRPSVAGALAGATLAPLVIPFSAVGWSIVTPDLRPARRFQALPETTGRLDQTTPALAWGWQGDAFTPAPRRPRPLSEGVFNPPAAQPSTWGWSVALPDLDNPRAVSGVLAGANLVPQPVTQVAAVAGWSVVLPDLPRIARQQAPYQLGRLDPVTSAAFPEGWAVQPPPLLYARRQIGVSCVDVVVPQPTVTPPWGWPVDAPITRRPQANPAGLAGKVSFATATQLPWGWVPVLPDLRLLLPTVSGALAGGTLAPQVIPFSAVGWSIVLPDLRAARRFQALPEATGRTDQTTPATRGWSIALPDLRGPRPISGVLAGVNLAPQPVTAVAAGPGWSVVLPDLRAARRFPALPETTGRLDQTVPALGWGWQVDAFTPPPRRPRPLSEGSSTPLGAQATPWGWSIVTPDLRAARRSQALPETTGRFDQTTPALWGWSIALPDLDNPRVVSGALVGASVAPQPVTQVAAVYGWSVEPPALRPIRRSALIVPDQAELYNPQAISTPPWGWQADSPILLRGRVALGSSRISLAIPPPASTASTSWGWSPELPQTRRPNANPSGLSGRSAFGPVPPPAYEGWQPVLPTTRMRTPTVGVLVGATLSPQVIPFSAVGWSIVLPDLRAARRFQALPEITGRIQPVTSVAAAPGWSIVTPDLRAARRYQALPETTGRLDQTVPATKGWPLVTLPDLRGKRPVSGVLAGASLAPQPVTAVAAAPGWSVVQPDLPQFRRKAAGGVAVPRLDKPQDQFFGWSVVVPDLPQFKRRSALPEGQGRLDPVTATVFAEGWAAVLPVTLPRPTRGGALAGADLPPTVPPLQPLGWSVTTPDLPVTTRRPPPQFSSGIDQPASVVTTAPWGWSVTTPDLPVTTRRDVGQALPRLDKPQDLVSGWSVVTPDLPSFKRNADISQALPRLDKPQPPPQGWSVVQPDLPQFRRKADVGVTLPRIDPPEVPSRGWPLVTLPDLPQARRKADVGVSAPRLDKPQDLALGWNIVLPDLPYPRHRHLPVPLDRLDPQAKPIVFAEGWTVEPPYLRRTLKQIGSSRTSIAGVPQGAPSQGAAAEQTYFISNVGRFMGRRG